MPKKKSSKIQKEVSEQKTGSFLPPKISGRVVRSRPVLTTGFWDDPLNAYNFLGIPLDLSKAEHRKAILRWCRFFYMTHPLVATAIDIYARYPLVGLEIFCKDKNVEKYYRDYYTDMSYDKFLVDVGLEYWKVGEAFILGEWNNTLGRFVSEELLNPEDVEVDYIPLLKRTTYKMNPPQRIVDIIKTKQPEAEYIYLKKKMPYLVDFVEKGKPVPLPAEVLYQMKFGAEQWSPRGYPILLRAFLTLLTEQKLMMAQQAVADRLYSPLILMKLGGQVGADDYWIPTEYDYNAYQERLEMALESNFRIMVGHSAMSIEAVQLGNTFPNMDTDFERLEEKLLQVFGIDKQLLVGGTRSTYASTAMSAEFLVQRMADYQKEIIRFLEQRFKAIAEAQEFYVLEKEGGVYKPVWEEYIEIDPETGEEIIRKRKKLLLPTISMQSVDIRDENTRRQILAQLRQMGIPISNRRLVSASMKNLDINEELEVLQKEQISMQLSILDSQMEQKAAFIEYFINRGKSKEEAIELAKQQMQILQQYGVGFGPPADDKGGGGLLGDMGLVPSPTAEGGDLLSPELAGQAGGLPDLSDVFGDNIPENLQEDNAPEQRPEVSDERKEEMPKP